MPEPALLPILGLILLPALRRTWAGSPTLINGDRAYLLRQSCSHSFAVGDALDIEGFARSRLPSFVVDGHIKTVVKEAEWLCGFYPEADRETVLASAWLHEIGQTLSGILDYGRKAREKREADEEHHLRGSRMAREYLTSKRFPEERIQEVLHCIESHRTSRPPDPRTIEAKIVASADNLSHFVDFDHIVGIIGLEEALKKLERDLSAEFMLSEATRRAEDLFHQIRSRHGV